MPATIAKAPTLQPAGFEPLTVDDWFNLPDSPERYELSEGMLIMAPAPDGHHQDIAAMIHYNFMLVAMPQGGWAMMAPTGLALARDTGYEPDVLYLSKARMGLKTRRGVEGAPDIVVEVLSPRTRRYDLRTKLPNYLVHGVTEVWIIDPAAQTVAVHRLDEEPEVVAFGQPIPSRVVDVGAAMLDQLPPLPDE